MTKTLVITPPFTEYFRPPISGAIICVIAEQAGHTVTAWDANIEAYDFFGHDVFYEMQLQFNDLQPLDKENDRKLDSFLADYPFDGFDYILISVLSKYEIAGARKLLNVIHQWKQDNKTAAKVVIGGPGVELNVGSANSNFGSDMFAKGFVDHYIIGEGEVALKELLANNTTYAGIDGMPPVQIANLDELPFPNYDYYDRTKYKYLDSANPDVFVYGSRGCVRSCAFCDVPFYWPQFRYRSGQNIADELIGYWEKYGVKNFFFTDSLVNGSLKAYREMHEAIARYPNLPKFHIAGYAIIRPKNQHPAELFDMMANTGTHFWSVGVEHGSDAMRFDMRKKFTNEDIDWHLEQSERIGLDNHWLLMPTWVNEKPEHHQEYLDMFKRWQRYVASNTIVSITMAPALSALQSTPLTALNSKYNISFKGLSTEMQEMLWVNKDNPDLDFAERHRRAIALWEEAIKYKWPMSEAKIKLLDMKSIVQKTIALTRD